MVKGLEARAPLSYGAGCREGFARRVKKEGLEARKTI
jgi:hypothetical protein